MLRVGDFIFVNASVDRHRSSGVFVVVAQRQRHRRRRQHHRVRQRRTPTESAPARRRLRRRAGAPAGSLSGRQPPIRSGRPDPPHPRGVRHAAPTGLPRPAAARARPPRRRPLPAASRAVACEAMLAARPRHGSPAGPALRVRRRDAATIRAAVAGAPPGAAAAPPDQVTVFAAPGEPLPGRLRTARAA